MNAQREAVYERISFIFFFIELNLACNKKTKIIDATAIISPVLFANIIDENNDKLDINIFRIFIHGCDFNNINPDNAIPKER